ncbi:MAG: hypothetical protein V4543_09550, partial [Bacteroidota bacterium]
MNLILTRALFMALLLVSIPARLYIALYISAYHKLKLIQYSRAGIFAVLLWLSALTFSFAQTDDGLPAAPDPPRLANDLANMMQPAEVQALEAE